MPNDKPSKKPNDVSIEEEAKRKKDEQDILFQKAAEEYQKLKKTDKRFIGIDLDTREYWILGNSFKIKTLGFTAKKDIGAALDKHDDFIAQIVKLDQPADAAKRGALMQSMDQTRDEIIEKCIPLLLDNDDGESFDATKWFGTSIPTVVWWDTVMDLYLFLRERGSREDIVRSMMQ